MLEFKSNDHLLVPGNYIQFLAVLQLRKDETEDSDDGIIDPIPVLMYGRIIAIEYKRNEALDEDTMVKGNKPWETKSFGFVPRALRVESNGGGDISARRWTLMYDSSWGGWTAVMNSHVVFGSSGKITASNDAYSLLIAKKTTRNITPDLSVDQPSYDNPFGEFVEFEDVEDVEDVEEQDGNDEDETPRFE